MPSVVLGKQGSQTALNGVTRNGVESYTSWPEICIQKKHSEQVHDTNFMAM